MQTTNNILHTHFKENPFRVPHGYFDSLPQQIGQKMGKTSPQRRILRPQLALAASFALMIGLGYTLVRLITPNRADTEFSYTESVSPFTTYTLLQSDEWNDSLDPESIITFLTEQNISLYAISSIDLS